MRSRTLALLVLFLGAISLFLFGIVAASLLGTLPPALVAGPPAATISLDLSGQVAALQAERARLSTALAQSVRDIKALEAQVAALPAAAREAGHADIAALRTALAAARARAAALESERDDARAQVKALARQATELREEREAMLTELTESRGAVAGLRRDLADTTNEDAAFRAQQDEDIAQLRGALVERDGAIAALQQRLAEAELQRAAIVPEPANPEPAAPARASAPERRKRTVAAENVTGSVTDGVVAYLAADYARAYAIWRPLAEAGNAQAQFHLGALYYEGRGVVRDIGVSRLWLDRAAANGSRSAVKLLVAIDEASAGR